MWTDQRGSEVLPLPECVRLLAVAAKGGMIGHLAVSTGHAPVIRPVNFAYHDESIILRVGPGLMAEAAADALVSFEIDCLDSATNMAWSVLVRGLATLLGEEERREVSHVALTPLVPSPGDTVLSVRLDVVSGRRFPMEPVAPSGGGSSVAGQQSTARPSPP